MSDETEEARYGSKLFHFEAPVRAEGGLCFDCVVSVFPWLATSLIFTDSDESWVSDFVTYAVERKRDGTCA